MARPAAPPMTSRQAKRAGRKQTAQFHYSEAQMRRADRNEELEQRRQTLEDKERKRKQNKRKRDEQAAKERQVQRKLLDEGRITVEDTWAKVTASQPRLNNFFTKKSPKQPKPLSPLKESPLKESCNAENKANGLKPKEDEPEAGLPADEPAFDSEEDTVVDKTNAPKAAAEPIFEEFTDADLLQMFSSQPGPPTPSRKPPLIQVQHAESASRATISLSRHSNHKTPTKMTTSTPSKPHNAPAKPPTKPPTTPTATTTANSQPTTPARVPSLVLPSTEPSEADRPIVVAAVSPDDENDPATVARRVRSVTPSPEISPQRRGGGGACRSPLTNNNNHNNYNYAPVRAPTAAAAAASQQSLSYSDDDLDDAVLVAVASSAERHAAAAAAVGAAGAPRFEPLPFPTVQGFSSSLPDEMLVEAVRRVEEGEGEGDEAQKKGPEEGEEEN